MFEAGGKDMHPVVIVALAIFALSSLDTITGLRHSKRTCSIPRTTRGYREELGHGAVVMRGSPEKA